MYLIKNNKIKLFIITLITAIIMGVSSITVYINVCAPKFYDDFIDTGVKYLIDGKYKEAILAFNKAIEIEEKSTEARVYLAQGYVGNNEYDKAIEALKEAQNLDITNEELLKQILEILNEIDADIAYEFLDRFINAVGKDNVSDDINKILDSAMEMPSIPLVNPEPGTYIKPISIKLKLDKIKVGHSFYYTTDGTEPNKNAQKYTGKIDIDKSTTIKLIGYNKKDESTGVIVIDYIIDTNILNDIKNLLDTSENLLNNTEVGTNIGNTTQEAKKEFKKVIDKTKNLLNKESLNYEDVISMKTEIDNTIKKFKENIIESTDKSKLKKSIDKAKKLYDNSKEGNKEGEYAPGSKEKLLNIINESQKVYDDILSRQNKIDNQVDLIEKQIKEFKSALNSNIERNLIGKFIIDNGNGVLIKFTENKILKGWYDVDECKILNKKIEGNKIYYTVKFHLDGYPNENLTIELIDSNTIRYSNEYGSSIDKLYNKYEFIKYFYNMGHTNAKDLYEEFKFWGITQQDINKFLESYN